MPVKSWIVKGTYNKVVKDQIHSIAVSVERRHAKKHKKGRPVLATMDDGKWVAIVTGHSTAKTHKPKQVAIVVFYDVNGVEVFRDEKQLSP